MLKLVIVAVLVLATGSTAHAVLTVTAEADRSQIRAGESLHITVRAIRPDSPSEPVPSHAALQLGTEWEAGAQAAESERVDSTGRVKTWHFTLIAKSPTQSSITPVVILAGTGDGAVSLATNRVLGPPLNVEILAPGARSWWMGYSLIVAAMAGLAASALVAVRVIRRKRQIRRPPLTPLEEATAMMHEIHVNCREDRAGQFFGDVEHVLTGYLSRRLGRRLSAATATEIAAMVGQHVADVAVLNDLRVILEHCATARFSGSGHRHDDLVETEEAARATLERLDAAWVTMTQPAAP